MESVKPSKSVRRLQKESAMNQLRKVGYIPVYSSTSSLNERLKLAIACNYLNPANPLAAYHALDYHLKCAQQGQKWPRKNGKAIKLKSDSEVLCLSRAEEEAMMRDPE